jgi:hypothetical protein
MALAPLPFAFSMEHFVEKHHQLQVSPAHFGRFSAQLQGVMDKSSRPCPSLKDHL